MTILRRRVPNLNSPKRICAICVLCALTGISSTAQISFTTLASLSSSSSDPYLMSLVQGRDGNFYGTSSTGRNANGQDAGSVFKITPSGTLSTLYSFCSQPNCSDGSYPSDTLALGTDGNFYGTTYISGADGRGTVFKIAPAGELTTLHSFADGSDGANPVGGLVEATDGNFYGTTGYGSNVGTLFKITPSGTLTTLYTFCAEINCADGRYPYGTLIQAPDGNFYGTTAYGGNTSCAGGEGCGTVFKMTPQGALTTLYRFCSQSGCSDGETPEAGLVQATDGNFYGTTTVGGTVSNSCYAGACGTIFKVTLAGEIITLYTFCAQPNCADGANPFAGLIQGTDGFLYGATQLGGSSGFGTVFRINSAGELTAVHSFTTNDGGTSPTGGLTQGTSGDFYGTTSLGGVNGDGTVFSLSLGLDPFVETIPAVGKVGHAIGIFGQGFQGTTAVNFNGIPAIYRVRSDTFLEAAIPAGATTGKITVMTPSGTLVSNVAFRVRP